jgi:hypothetical protein
MAWRWPYNWSKRVATFCYVIQLCRWRQYFLTCTDAVGCLRKKTLSKLLYGVMEVKNALVTPVFCVTSWSSNVFIFVTPTLNWRKINPRGRYCPFCNVDRLTTAKGLLQIRRHYPRDVTVIVGTVLTDRPLVLAESCGRPELVCIIEQ